MMNELPNTDVSAMEPMDDAELEAIIGQDLTDAVSYVDSDLSPIRARGTEYYRGDKFGNEEDGRSQVVAMEVRDTVSAMMPSLMRVFFSSENVVEFVPEGPEDVAFAKQATDYGRCAKGSKDPSHSVLHTFLCCEGGHCDIKNTPAKSDKASFKHQ